MEPVRAPFLERLESYQLRVSSLLCVGIDPDPRYMGLSDFDGSSLFSFCKDLVIQTAPFVCAFKIQVARFAAYGFEDEVRRLVDFIHLHYPDIIVILDAKRGDVPFTSECYAKECFERYSADAATVNPYLGADAVLPFSSYQESGDRGVFVLCKTSNLGSSDLQECTLYDGCNVYMRVAGLVSKFCSKYNNCGLVVGATYPDAISEIRLSYPHLWFLAPGCGVQGASLEKLMEATGGNKVLVAISRSISYPSYFFKDMSFFKDSKATPASVALFMRDRINKYRAVNVS
ncbi:orotidine-5'-phosphate decarboxylase [Candidatus Ichthyocystis sparus]|uniref:orotidine-5'-phosphate decarboxylase n=1 Tax=Candidatus Ichthyocystis sparus TaxID=1561004 RepID=UPI000A40CB50|nr:orotidine-5'-phosphate decarboxylase [Candidatus Ichthyocystis sparus]